MFCLPLTSDTHFTVTSQISEIDLADWVKKYSCVTFVCPRRTRVIKDWFPQWPLNQLSFIFDKLVIFMLLISLKILTAQCNMFYFVSKAESLCCSKQKYCCLLPGLQMNRPVHFQEYLLGIQKNIIFLFSKRCTPLIMIKNSFLY